MKKAIKKAAALIAAAVMMISLGACAKTDAPKSGGIKIISVNFPPYDFIKQITGGELQPEILLKGGMDAHSYEPTAKDIVRINDADLFICTGGESDAWVDTISDSLDGNVKIVKIMDYVELLNEDEDEDEEETENHNHYQSEPEYDEHVWTSPKNAVKISEGLTDVLCGLCPEKADKYRDGLKSYVSELNTLSDELDKAAKELKKPLIVGDRFPFKYLANDYGIEYYAAFSGCSTETEPSASKMSFLIDKAKETDAKVIYHIEFSTKKVAETIAEAVGADIRMLHSCHSLSDEDLTAGETYISIMRKNIQNMRDR